MDTQSYNDKLNCFREKYQYITSKFPQISILKEHIDKALCTESAASIRPNLLQLCRIIEDTPMPPDVREELQTFFQHEHQGRMTFGSYLYGRFLAHVILAREAPETYVDLLLDHSNCLEGSGDALSEALGSDQRQNALQIFDILVDKCNIERTTERVYFPQKNDTVPHIFHMTDMSGTCSEEPLFLLFMMAKSNQDVFLQLLNRLRAPAHIDMLFHWVDASGSMDDLPGLLDLMDSCISGDNWTGALPVPMFAFSCHLLVSMHMQKQSMTEENAESFFRRFADHLVRRADALWVMSWMGEYLIPRALRFPDIASQKPDERCTDIFFDVLRETVFQKNLAEALVGKFLEITASEAEKNAVELFLTCGYRTLSLPPSKAALLLAVSYMLPEDSSAGLQKKVIAAYEQQLCLQGIPSSFQIGNHRCPADVHYALAYSYMLQEHPFTAWKHTLFLMKAAWNRDMRKSYGEEITKNGNTILFHFVTGLALSDHLAQNKCTDECMNVLQAIISIVRLQLLIRYPNHPAEHSFTRIARLAAVRIFLYAPEEEKFSLCRNAIESMKGFPRTAVDMVISLLSNGAHAKFFHTDQFFLQRIRTLFLCLINEAEQDVWRSSQLNLSALQSWLKKLNSHDSAS